MPQPSIHSQKDIDLHYHHNDLPYNRSYENARGREASHLKGEWGEEEAEHQPNVGRVFPHHLHTGQVWHLDAIQFTQWSCRGEELGQPQVTKNMPKSG